MELLYIWIDGFRNFKNVGFNFSNSFEIDYHKETTLLSINKISNGYNIFEDNITNVTGIVGKNSTGKSNLLELISMILKSKKSTLTFDFIAAYRANYTTTNRISIYSNIRPEIRIDNASNILINSEELKHLNVVYFSNIQDDRDLNIPRSVINLTPNKSQTRKKSDMLNQFKFLLTEEFLNLDLESPDNLIISTIIKSSYTQEKTNINNLDNYIIEEIKNKFKNALKTTDPIKHFTYSFNYSLFSYVLLGAINEVEDKKRELFEVNPDFSNIKNLFSRSFQNISKYNIIELIGSIKDFISLVFYEFTKVGSLSKKEAMSLMDFDRAIKYLNPKLIKEGKYNQSRSYYLVEFNSENKKILREYLSIFNHNRIIELSWGGISSGHKAFLNVFSQFNSVIKKVNNKSNVLICIDEGDLYMHPVWQQEFLYRLLNYLASIYHVQIQIILTSHSPFLVSDLPRRNIIYLDRTEENMCRVIPYSESKDETFGANLLDLYANSFFLSGGTISKFAYHKIKDVVKMLKRDNSSNLKYDEIESLVSKIGDDVIKLKLEKMIKNAKNRN